MAAPLHNWLVLARGRSSGGRIVLVSSHKTHSLCPQHKKTQSLNDSTGGQNTEQEWRLRMFFGAKKASLASLD